MTFPKTLICLTTAEYPPGLLGYLTSFPTWRRCTETTWIIGEDVESVIAEMTATWRTLPFVAVDVTSTRWGGHCYSETPSDN